MPTFASVRACPCPWMCLLSIVVKLPVSHFNLVILRWSRPWNSNSTISDRTLVWYNFARVKSLNRDMFLLLLLCACQRKAEICETIIATFCTWATHQRSDIWHCYCQAGKNQIRVAIACYTLNSVRNTLQALSEIADPIQQQIASQAN